MFTLSRAETSQDRPWNAEISPYLVKEPRILRDACRTAGRDDHGRHCPSCAVRYLCETQARRASAFSPAA